MTVDGGCSGVSAMGGGLVTSDEYASASLTIWVGLPSLFTNQIEKRRKKKSLSNPRYGRLTNQIQMRNLRSTGNISAHYLSRALASWIK